MIAKVVLEIPVEKEFDYIIPDRLKDKISPGIMVSVPFRNKTVRGYVISLSKESRLKELKEIKDITDEAPILTEKILKLAHWISDYYLSPIGIVIKSLLPPGVRSNKGWRKNLYVTPNLKPEELKQVITKIEKRSPKQASILHVILSSLNSAEGFEINRLISSAKASRSSLFSLINKGYLSLIEKSPLKEGKIIFDYPKSSELTLTDEQEYALSRINNALDKELFETFLIKGVTGSGKTEIYLNAINSAIQKDKGAIVLVPEISLTPQTIDRFRQRVKEPLAILHSALSAGERSHQWKQIRSGKARIVIGARSAIFSPVKNLGLIIVDEEHERSYKQEEQPRYNARDLAVMRGKLEKAVVVLGSATPSLESYYNVAHGKYSLLNINKRVDGRALPDIEVVDMRSDRQNIKLSCSQELAGEIDKRLAAGEQSILFLNRRGFSSSLICPKCGETIKCKSCSISMTYHRSKNMLMCHLCGYQKRPPEICPSCKGRKVFQIGLGTEKVQHHIEKLFPGTKVLRMDSDTTSFKGAHKKLLTEFKHKKYQILVGTQMIAKGLDFPDVTLVGIIFADLSLSFPDFRSSETTFQLLTQAAGRAGRGSVPGKVIIQTCLPGHYSIKSAALQNYEAFAEKELEFRKELNYPPFAHIINFVISGKFEKAVSKQAEKLTFLLKRHIEPGINILGPCPCAISRSKTKFRWQVMIKGKSVSALHKRARGVLAKLKKSKGIAITVDVDPLNLM